MPEIKKSNQVDHSTRCLLLLGMVWTAAVCAQLPSLKQGEASTTPPQPTRIDPNKAAWHELATLPGLGEITARSIVAYRDSPRENRPANPTPQAFSNAGDLTLVRGVGPITVRRMAPYLRFD